MVKTSYGDNVVVLESPKEKFTGIRSGQQVELEGVWLSRGAGGVRPVSGACTARALLLDRGALQCRGVSGRAAAAREWWREGLPGLTEGTHRPSPSAGFTHAEATNCFVGTKVRKVAGGEVASGRNVVARERAAAAAACCAAPPRGPGPSPTATRALSCRACRAMLRCFSSPSTTGGSASAACSGRLGQAARWDAPTFPPPHAPHCLLPRSPHPWSRQLQHRPTPVFCRRERPGGACERPGTCRDARWRAAQVRGRCTARAAPTKAVPPGVRAGPPASCTAS